MVIEVDINLPLVATLNPNLKQQFRYQFPSSFIECHLISFNWNVPLVLSIFKDFKTLMKVITTILLERSVVVVSRSPSKLSAVILGLLELISPF